EGNRGLYGTFSQWLQEAKISEREYDRNGDGKVEGKEIVAYVLGHFDKFSPKIQKQIEVLQKTFRALGFGDEEAKAILTGEPKAGAKSLVEKGREFEKRAGQVQGRDNGNKKTYRDLIGNAERAYRLAVDLDPGDVQARKHLSDLLYRQGDAKAGREHAAQAVRNAPLQEIPDLIRWLQTLPDAGIKKNPTIYFVGAELVHGGRHADARELFEGVARNLAKDGETAKAQKYREKAMLADEMGKPWRLDFDAKTNPEVHSIYEALRARGIPTEMMAGALPSGKVGAERTLTAAQVLAFWDQNGDDPRVKELGIEIPRPKFKDAARQAEFEKLSSSQKLSAYHQGRADAARDDKTKAKHLAAAAHYDPNSAEKSRKLGEFHAGRKNYASAVAAYENSLRIDPANAADRRVLADLHLAEGRWDLAYKVLPRDKAEKLMTEKLEEARQCSRSGEHEKAKAIVQTARGLLEEPSKKVGDLPADEAGLTLRLKARLDLASGEIQSREAGWVPEGAPSGPDPGVADYQKAVEAATQAIQKNPKDIDAYLIRAQAQDKLGMGTSAMADYQAVVNIAGRDALPADYRDFASRYRKQVRAEYQTEVDNFERFAYETGEAEQKLAQESLAKLEALSLVLKSFPEASKTERFEDQKMVREFYQLRVQYNEAQGTMVYVGVLPKEPEKLDDATSVASLAKNVFLGPSGLGQVVKPVTDVIDKAQADAQQAEEHNAHLKSIGYAGKKGAYQAELDALDAEMKELRQDLLANLEPKDKCVDPKAQLSQIRLLIQIDLELGLLDYDHIVRDFEAWERIVDQNAEVFARNPQLFLENWNATWELNLKIPTTQVAGGVFEPQEAILKKMKGIIRDPEFQKNLRANYEKTAGPAWDQAAFDQLLRQFDEGFDVTKLKLLTPYISEQGLKIYFSKNQQAKALEKRYDESTLHVDPAGDLEAGLQALKLYAELGNEPKVSQLIEQFRNDVQQSIHAREVHDVLGNIELLHLNQQMALALRGTDLRPKPGEETYENQVLNDARRLARSLQGDCFVVSTEEVQGLVAARAFFESDRDSLNVAEVDKKLKEGRDYLEAAIESRVPLLESSTEREMRSYGTEFSLYKPEERQATLRQNAALVEADLTLMGTQDLSKPEVRKEVGRKLLKHLDLWRRNLEANPDLPLEFRIEQYRQMAATTALFNKNFTTGDDPIMHKVEPAVSDEVKNTREWQHDQAGAPPNLETQTEAIAELGKALIEENSYAFYHQLPENMHYIVATIHSHGLSGRIEEGIVGYYMKRAEDAARLGIKVEESHYKPITEKEWQKIDEIRTLYQGSGLTQETMI
ncbi:MAG: hypothetical protein IT573_09210, partial [Deltaproteobacteria bacterium]|nr:hypothetical protein [Deltaproteobacteria bacterium]